MDPITKALVDYNEYLEEGGERIRLAPKDTVRTKVRKLHPSKIGPGLCDRSAVYDVMKDIGELAVEGHGWQQMLSFRVGHIYHDFTVEAIQHAGALIDYEAVVEDDDWTGRIDVLADHGRLVGSSEIDHVMLVDVKTVRSKVIKRYLEGLPEEVSKVSTQRVKKDTDLTEIPKRTFHRSLELVCSATDWFLEGRSFTRYSSLFSEE